MSLIVAPPFPPDAYQKILTGSGGDPEAVFVDLGIPVAQRYLSQTGVFPQHTGLIEPMLRATWQIIHRQSLPQPLAKAETGEAQDPDEAKIADLQERVAQQTGRELPESLQTLLYQLLVMLTQPEFKACRLSYLEKGVDGTVERQKADYCEDRISGSHCEDCPYFVALSQEKHERFIGKQWTEDPAEYEEQKSRFLPEDFRMLRIFWYLHIREGKT